MKSNSWLSSVTLLLPGIVLLILFFLIPALCTAILSLTDWTIGSTDPVHFIGLKNYFTLFSDPNFWVSVNNTLYLTVLVVPISFVVALGLALAMNASGKWSALWQSLYFLPTTASLVAMGVVWEYLLHPTLGLSAHIIRFFGSTVEINWLNDPDLVLITIAVISIWQSVGYYTLVFLSGLLQIPSSLYEAARIDGMGEWKIYSRIILPLSKPALVTLGIYHFMNNWNDLLYPMMLTTSVEMRTLSAGLAILVGSNSIRIGPTLAATVISVAPLLILFLFGQRFFMEGIATSGMKE